MYIRARRPLAKLAQESRSSQAESPGAGREQGGGELAMIFSCAHFKTRKILWFARY
jgi:hypothetical protein